MNDAELKAARLSDDIGRRLSPHGLHLLGWFKNADDQPSALIGNTGSSHWPSYLQSPEAGDGQTDPMNRWTQRIVGKVADELTCEVRYPFGDDLWPFQQWALSATHKPNSG